MARKKKPHWLVLNERERRRQWEQNHRMEEMEDAQREDPRRYQSFQRFSPLIKDNE